MNDVASKWRAKAFRSGWECIEVCDRGIGSPASTRASGEEHQLPGGIVASTEGGKFKREVRCQKRYLIARIGELGQKLSLCTNRQEVLLCWDKLENWEKT